MSEELIRSLNKRISELEERLTNIGSAHKQAKMEAREAKAKLADMDGLLSRAQAERDDWRTKAEAAPSEQMARISELEGQIAARDHRDAFRSEAMAGGVSPAYVDDLYMLSGLKPGEGPIQSGSFAEFLTAAKTSRSWAFGTSQPSGQNGATQPSGQNGTAQGSLVVGSYPPPGAGRSASVAPVNGVRYTADEVRRPGWQQSRPELVEALQRGTAVFVE